MRKGLIIFPALLIATPAAAQQLPPALTGPASVQQVASAAQALTDALLDVRVGEVRAAIDGREATPAERHMTVRELARRDDPDFDRHLHQQIATVGPKLQQSMQAVNRALPALMQSLEQAQQSIERAVANLPDPSYPRR
jgi:hypothetical protein